MLILLAAGMLLLLGALAFYAGVYLRVHTERPAGKSHRNRLTAVLSAESVPGLVESLVVLVLIFGVVVESSNATDSPKLLEQLLTAVGLQIRSGSAFREPTVLGYARRALTART